MILAMRFSNDQIRQHFALATIGTTKYVAYVVPGSFASTAWVEFDENRTMTPRVEALFSDDGQAASVHRDNLKRIQSDEELINLLTDPSVKVGDLFRDWVLQESEGERVIRHFMFGLYRSE